METAFSRHFHFVFWHHEQREYLGVKKGIIWSIINKRGKHPLNQSELKHTFSGLLTPWILLISNQQVHVLSAKVSRE